MTRSWGRPLQPLRPVAGVVAMLGVWWLVGHNSGAGWVQVIGDALAGILAVGLFGPAVVLGRCRVTLGEAGGGSTAGSPVELEVTASTRVRIRPVSPPGLEVLAGPIRSSGDVTPTGEDRLVLLPEHRGVHSVVVVDVATAAPFALLWWTRRLALNLRTELVVAPRLGPPVRLPAHDDDTSGGGGRHLALAPVGEPHGVRPYRAGDGRRSVHWPATAHAGGLMVREKEAPTAEPLTITVVLPADREEAERAAEQALGTVVALLDRGVAVTLATDEAGGPTIGPVADRRQAGRRLARAVAGKRAPMGPEVTVS